MGVGNTLVGLSSYGLLIWLNVSPAPAGALAWLLGTLHGYYWNRVWTFEGAEHRTELLGRYAAVGVAGAALNAGLIALLVGPLGIARFLAGVLALPFVVGTTFALNRWWTFGGHLSEIDARAGPEAEG